MRKSTAANSIAVGTLVLVGGAAAFLLSREPGDVSVPMIRFRDAELEAAVQRTSDRVDALAWKHRDARRAARRAAGPGA